jgi:hypothetical protein
MVTGLNLVVAVKVGGGAYCSVLKKDIYKWQRVAADVINNLSFNFGCSVFFLGN